MDIEAIKEAKTDAERKIVTALQELEEQTKCSVKNIDLIWEGECYTRPKMILSVRIQLQVE